MLCSQCSRLVKPIVVLDIDGTLGQYHSHLAEFAWSWHGTFYANPSGWDGRGNFEDWLRVSHAEYQQIKLAFRQGGQKRTMPLYDDMVPLLEVLRMEQREGRVEIWLATHRPWLRMDNMDPDTQHWLRRNQIPFDHLLFSDDKYRDLLEQVDGDRIVLVVEDLPEMVAAAQAYELPAVQVARQHNSHPSQRSSKRVEARVLPELAENSIQQWNSKHQGDA